MSVPLKSSNTIDLNQVRKRNGKSAAPDRRVYGAPDDSDNTGNNTGNNSGDNSGDSCGDSCERSESNNGDDRGSYQHGIDHKELRYRLSAALQTTLDLKPMLSLLRQELLSVMELDGLQYSNEDLKIKMLSGKQISHSCGYRLITDTHNLGELIFYRDKRFSGKELEIIEVALSAMLCPLKNALLYRDAMLASMNDPLTGAGNRIALDKALDREIKLSQRYKQPLSVLILDIDCFKAINDRNGHSAGDQVLCELVEKLGCIKRSTDSNFRYGGEEFVILLSKTDLHGALIAAERIRQAVEGMEIRYDDELIKLSVSIGAASYCSDDTRQSLFNRADKALYQIKRSGGNQVMGL